MTVTVIRVIWISRMSRITPKSVSAFSAVNQWDHPDNRESRVIIVKIAFIFRRMSLAQAARLYYQRAPLYFVRWNSSPTNQEASSMNKNSLTVGHLLKHLIPTCTHSPAMQEHLSHLTIIETIS